MLCVYLVTIFIIIFIIIIVCLCCIYNRHNNKGTRGLGHSGSVFSAMLLPSNYIYEQKTPPCCAYLTSTVPSASRTGSGQKELFPFGVFLFLFLFLWLFLSLSSSFLPFVGLFIPHIHCHSSNVDW